MAAEGVTARQLYEALQDLENRLGDKIDKAAARLEQKLDDHAADDRTVADRVLGIEQREANRNQEASRMGVWAGIVAAFGLTAGWEALKHYAGWK